MARRLKMSGITLRPALNPEACKRSEAFVVWEVNGRKLIETQPTAERAQHACDVLNKHAQEHGGEFVTWDFCEES